MVPGGLAIAQSSSRIQNHPYGGGFVGMLNEKLRGSLKLAPRFLKKVSEIRQCAKEAESWYGVSKQAILKL